MIRLRIKEEAAKRGLLLKDVRERAGYKSRTSFSRQINNPESINMSTLLRIAEAIGCEVKDFFIEDDLVPPLRCPHCGKKLKVRIE